MGHTVTVRKEMTNPTAERETRMRRSFTAHIPAHIPARIPAYFLAPAIAAALAGTASTASAQGLYMFYSVVDLGGGLFEYEFRVTPQSGWVSGMGWGGLVFGDERSVAAGGSGVSPLDDFTMDPAQFPVGPWTSFTISSGEHNGPTFSPALDLWIPASSNEVLTWRGESLGLVGSREMLYSTLSVTGGAQAANFRVARTCPCACAFCTVTGVTFCDIKDFLAFQNGFVNGALCACNYDTSTGPGVCDIFDFLAFQSDYVNHCR